MYWQADFVRRLRGVLFVLLVINAMAIGKVIYVDDDALAVYDGSSWAYAYRSLWDAIAEVLPGDEIRVAEGVYQPDRRTVIVGGRSGSGKPEFTASGDRTATFELINNVTFKGGYAGYGAPYPNARDINRYETILSGDLAGNDVDDPEAREYRSSKMENSYHVVTGSGPAILDGFTITGGFANDHTMQDGGGLYNEYGALQITNCTFRRNFAEGSGGAIYNYRANPKLESCTFLANTSEAVGGAMHNFQSDPTLINCTFIGNWTDYGGGGIHNDQSSPSLEGCTFIENSAFYGGGIYNHSRGIPVLTNCTFRGNLGRDYGGGIYNFGSDPLLTNCIFTANEGSLYGGGMSCHNSDAILTNCTFTGNLAPNGTSLAFNGGFSNVKIVNGILWEDNPIWIIDNSIVDISYSNISGRGADRNNIDEDPLFVDLKGPDGLTGTGDEDLRLSLQSPCVDTGDPRYTPGPEETDFGGDRRIVGGQVDMGAYEFQGLLYVDDDALDEVGRVNPLTYGTEHDPFKTIQEAIDAAKDGYTVLVRPGVYDKFDFAGKSITVRGTDGSAVIEAWSSGRDGPVKEDAVTFHTGEGPESVLKNFIIRNSGIAVSINSRSSPTISNLTIVDNDFGIAAYENSNPDISNCIFWNNTDGDLFQCNVRYSCVESGAPGEGNITVDPLFVVPSSMVHLSSADYHLKSEGWRWSEYEQSWTYDEVTSRCIDAGDPASPLADELMSVPRDPENLYGRNRRINMGAFGGTSQASIPPYDWVLPEYETDSPQPDPAQWAPNGVPKEVPSEDGIFGYYAQMTAMESTDASRWVEYFFECPTEAGFNSDWQISNTYSVRIGRSGQGQKFRVKARDLYGNETEWSEELTAN